MSSLFDFIGNILKTFISFNVLNLFFLHLGFMQDLYIFLKVGYIIILILYTIKAFPLIIENLKITIENKKLKKNEKGNSRDI